MGRKSGFVRIYAGTWRGTVVDQDIDGRPFDEHRLPRPTREEIVAHMNGNLCRCMAYPRIQRAIRAAADGQEDIA